MIYRENLEPQKSFSAAQQPRKQKRLTQELADAKTSTKSLLAQTGTRLGETVGVFRQRRSGNTLFLISGDPKSFHKKNQLSFQRPGARRKGAVQCLQRLLIGNHHAGIESILKQTLQRLEIWKCLSLTIDHW